MYDYSEREIDVMLIHVVVCCPVLFVLDGLLYLVPSSPVLECHADEEGVIPTSRHPASLSSKWYCTVLEKANGRR